MCIIAVRCRYRRNAQQILVLLVSTEEMLVGEFCIQPAYVGLKLMHLGGGGHMLLMDLGGVFFLVAFWEVGLFK